MNTEQLEKAKSAYGFAMEITLKGNRMYVADCGFITDDLKEITAKKHYGFCEGFYYQYTKKGYIGTLVSVIREMQRDYSGVLMGVTA